MHHLKTRSAVWLTALFVTLGLCLLGSGSATADPGTSKDDSCTTGSFQGSSVDGTWTRNYKPNCDGVTTGSVTISWGNTGTGPYDHHIWWNASVTAGAISGNDCVEVALDWQNPTGDHSDVQYVRNCYEHSTYAPPALPQTLETDGYTSGSDWSVRSIQIATYDISTSTVRDVVCPSTSALPWSANDTNCSNWLVLHGAATWTSKAAKIYRRSNAGNDANNDPTYPGNYTILNQRMSDF